MTPEIVGCVVYTGHETKLMLDSRRSAPVKKTKIERKMNQFILVLVSLLTILTFSFTCLFEFSGKKLLKKHWYLDKKSKLILSIQFFFFLFL